MPKRVVSNRAARGHFTRRYGKSLEKTSDFVKRQARGSVIFQEWLSAEALGMAGSPELRDLQGFESFPNPVMHFTFEVPSAELEKAVASLRSLFEADEDGWPVWRSELSERESRAASS